MAGNQSAAELNEGSGLIFWNRRFQFGPGKGRNGNGCVLRDRAVLPEGTDEALAECTDLRRDQDAYSTEVEG